MIVAYQRKRYTRGLGTDLAKTGVERSPKSSPLRRALRAIGLTRAGKPRNCRICRLSFRIAVKECRQVLTVALTMLKKVTAIGDSRRGNQSCWGSYIAGTVVLRRFSFFLTASHSH
jgi:hypothetical protein